MSLGLSPVLSLSVKRPSSGGGSVITTANFTVINPTHAQIIDIDSARLCRDGALNGQFTATLPPGNYRVRLTLAAYDGAISGITTTALRISDNNTARFTGSTLGAFDSGTISIASGTIRFLTNAVGAGARFDGLLVEAA